MIKKTLVISLVLATILSCGLFSQKAYASTNDWAKGKILLQVESHGEAWYVYPDNMQRYYLGRPSDAFNIMKTLGLGISNADLAKIPYGSVNYGIAYDTDRDGLTDQEEISFYTYWSNADSDKDGFLDGDEVRNGYNPTVGNGAKLNIDTALAKRLSGKILLQVENKGQAWYVNPKDNKRYFLGGPTDAFNVMKYLGLGVTTANLEKIPAATLYTNTSTSTYTYTTYPSTTYAYTTTPCTSYVYSTSPCTTYTTNSVTVTDNRKISGRVIDSKTGKAISGATITVSSTSIYTQTDVNGNYTLYLTSKNIGDKVDIYATENFYKISPVKKITVGTDLYADFYLEPEIISPTNNYLVYPTVNYYSGSMNIKGRVIDRNGKGVSGITIAAEDSGSSAVTDSNGYYTTNWPGSSVTMRLYLTSSKYNFTEENNYYQITTRSGYTTEVNFTISL